MLPARKTRRCRADPVSDRTLGVAIATLTIEPKAASVFGPEMPAANEPGRRVSGYLLNWLRPSGFDIAQWPRLKAYRARLRERPSVRAALGAEGILKH